MTGPLHVRVSPVQCVPGVPAPLAQCVPDVRVLLAPAVIAAPAPLDSDALGAFAPADGDLVPGVPVVASPSPASYVLAGDIPSPAVPPRVPPEAAPSPAAASHVPPAGPLPRAVAPHVPAAGVPAENPCLCIAMWNQRRLASAHQPSCQSDLHLDRPCLPAFFRQGVGPYPTPSCYSGWFLFGYRRRSSRSWSNYFCRMPVQRCCLGKFLAVYRTQPASWGRKVFRWPR